MKKKLFSITIFFTIIIIIVTGIIGLSDKKVSSQDNKSEMLVAINEIEQLAKLEEYEKMSDKIADLQENIRLEQAVSNDNNRLFIMCGICIVFLITIFGYIYFAILRPFDKMKNFAEKIAQGNFDIPLNYERSNYFGAFTWAFDSMRREITKARSCEREAIENNKTVIATLSHDIKTPIASVRAYAEGLEANMDSSLEKRQRYISVIMKKCDEVSRLTNDLFLHSLSDLDKLKIIPEQFEICSFIEMAISGILAEQNDICFVKPDFSAMVSADKNRLVQIVENIINNARKYAKSNIDISLINVENKSENIVEIHFRDYGRGIPDEDMPFIFDKFYRGKNCGDEKGSGLGLYIVKYVIEQMNGNVMLNNHIDGLEVVIDLPII